MFLFLFGVREDLCIELGNYKSYRDIVHTTTRETTPSEALILLASQQFLLKPAPQKNSNVNTDLPQKIYPPAPVVSPENSPESRGFFEGSVCCHGFQRSSWSENFGWISTAPRQKAMAARWEKL